MSKTLGEAIIVPRVFMSLTTRYVLVTQWVEGVKVRGQQRMADDMRSSKFD